MYLKNTMIKKTTVGKNKTLWEIGDLMVTGNIQSQTYSSVPSLNTTNMQQHVFKQIKHKIKPPTV
jgi:hypothetical protein